MCVKLPNQKKLAEIAAKRANQPHVVVDAFTGYQYIECPTMAEAELACARLEEQYPDMIYQILFAG